MEHDKLEELKRKAEKLGVDINDLLRKAMDDLTSKAKGKDKEKNIVTKEEADNNIEGLSDETITQAWEKVQIARHPDRPTTMEYIEYISDQFMELHGDRYAGDDAAMVGGVCTLDGIHFTFIGNQKGANMKENITRNYGMSHPEGYRKAYRLAKQAERFGRPIITFIDTSGAYPGLASEERGIGEAIAKNLLEFSMLTTPVICIIIGEGGSGGALGIGIGDRIFMLENSVYSVISPEGFASILLRDASRSKEAAALMKMTAEDIYEAGFIDGIIAEPLGGAHEDFTTTAENIKSVILKNYQELKTKDISQLLQQRSQKIINWTRNENTQITSDEQAKPLLKRMKDFFTE